MSKFWINLCGKTKRGYFSAKDVGSAFHGRSHSSIIADYAVTYFARNVRSTKLNFNPFRVLVNSVFAKLVGILTVNNAKEKIPIVPSMKQKMRKSLPVEYGAFIKTPANDDTGFETLPYIQGADPANIGNIMTTLCIHVRVCVACMNFSILRG